MQARVEVAVLGPVSAAREGRSVALGTPRQRTVLTALGLHRGTPAPPETVAELIWGRLRPSAWENTLQSYMAGLRRALEPDRPSRAPATVVVLERGGYALRNVTVDADVFVADLHAIRTQLGGDRDTLGLLPRVTAARAEELVTSFDGVLALWRGAPFAELDDAPGAVAGRARLEELRLLALEDRAALEIRMGREGRAAADLEALTATHPLRERLWALRALALARTGRQGDALASLAAVRKVLAEELGIDPGPQLVDLQLAVLSQDSALAARSDRYRPAPASVETPLVGRNDEIGRLIALHDQVRKTPGRPQIALVTGEAGIGKSRLLRELASHAERTGTHVVASRCPQDEGAPALWPWSQLLAGLGARLPIPNGDDPGARFRARSQCVDALLEAAGGRPTLVMIDDLHWADPSTLQVLSFLVDDERSIHMMVVLTWRTEAETTQLAAFAANAARQHPLRLPLPGISALAAERLVRDAGAAGLTPAEASTWTERTAGNPFFLVELARLRREDAAVGAAVMDSIGIRDVLKQRLATLPPAAHSILQVAAVLGRDIEVTTLAAVAGRSEDDVVDGLESARAAGLVEEVDIDRFRFAHDLLRDAAHAQVTRTRSARLHATAGDTLTRRGVPGREQDIARHWLAAGPAYADRAWRAAREAASAARRVHAHDERATSLREALDAVARDADALLEDRCDLLLELADADRLAGRWSTVRPVVHEALEIAHRLGDVDRAFLAATLPTDGALWLASPYGEVDEVVSSALRRLLVDLPASDDLRRCRTGLSLASEIYYAASIAERDALVDEAIAMAGRLGDDQLLLAAYLGGARSVWRSARSEEQARLAAEAVELARRLDDGLALADALTARAAAASDLGLVEELIDYLASARTAARDHRLLFDTVVIDGLEIAWRTLRGENEEVERLIADLTRATDQIEMAQARGTGAAVTIMQLLWSGQYETLLSTLQDAEDDVGLPVGSFIAAMMGRTGRADEAAAYLATHDLRLDVDDWLSPALWSMAAEAAMHTGDRAMAATVYRRLAPLAGRPATAGSSVIVGPIDMFLAMAARTVGEQDLARRHAADAEQVAARWQAGPVLRWVRAERVRWETAHV